MKPSLDEASLQSNKGVGRLTYWYLNAARQGFTKLFSLVQNKSPAVMLQ